MLNDTRSGKFDDRYTGPYRAEEPVSPAVTKIRRENKSVIVHNDKLKLAKANIDVIRYKFELEYGRGQF